jgi:GNAT superfamily N-acetyltransferase
MVFSKWLRSLRYGNDYFKLIDQDSYYKSYHAYIERILFNGAEIRLAVLAEDTDCVLGFSVSRGCTLDYVHVHRDYRRTAIGTSLLPPMVEAITHITKNGMSFWNARLKDAKFDPFR